MDPKTCPSCGAAIDADHPQGLCPACLLQQGLKTDKPTRGAHLSCAACQNALAEDARFCARCGTPAPAAPATTEGDPVRAALEAKLQGQYRIVRLLGRGGMGAVYLARDLTLDREVAIKVVKTDEGARETFERLRREAKTAARLSHPNIVPLHAFGEVEGMPYFVMGYVRGEPLAARLRRDGKLPEDEARRVLAEVADALDHAHRQGIVHRDVKPDNVLLEDESGRALLTDFGVAKAAGKGETLTRMGSVVGTPHYMSPEQAAGRADIDGRTDIYSLGVMAYAMLAGRLPFEGGTAADVLTKHLTQEPPALRSLAATVSDSTVQAVERCLAKDPARRWPDARSLKLALGAVEESQLPDALRAAEGKGLPTVAVAMALSILWLVNPMPDTAGFAFPLFMYPLFYLVALTRLRREGFSLRQSQSAIWREPAWWPFWYPRPLRRRGNVWDRLSAAVRLIRWWLLAVCGYFLIVVIGVGVVLVGNVMGGREAWSVERGFEAFSVFGGITATALWFVLRARAQRELIRKGLALADVHRVMSSVPPSRVSFWARPHIAAVLAPAARPEPSRPEGSPHDQLQSILRHADELSGPLRPFGAEAAVAGRQLIASIEHADREIAELARNLEPGEEQRLADKIEALAPAPGRDDEYAPMRQLLEKQLELIRGLSGRIEGSKAARSRRVEMLKTLNLHLASLRARSPETPTEVRSVSERVRAICDDIARQALALDDRPASAGSGIDDMATRERPRR
jgi:hypothetical protein